MIRDQLKAALVTAMKSGDKQRTATIRLVQADTAPGQSRVHPQYAHAPLPFAHLFVQAIGCHRQRDGPTGCVPSAR